MTSNVHDTVGLQSAAIGPASTSTFGSGVLNCRDSGGNVLVAAVTQRQDMTTDIASQISDPRPGESTPALLRAAVAAYLARFTGLSRSHTDSDLQIYLRWCATHDLNPFTVTRVNVERYVRWLQEIRRFKPSTVSRRLAVVCGFYRTCVIDGLLPHSPADYARRPTVPPESPTLGLSHLQFEAMLTTARASTNPNDFALVAMLGLLGLRIFEATGASISDLGEEHGHRVLRVVGKGTKVVLVPLPPAVSRAIDQAVDERTTGPVLRNQHGRRMDRHAATRRLKHLAAAAGVRMPRMHPHMPHVRDHHARRRRPTARRADRRPPR
jgi:site-specific recombinase XerD